MKNPGNVKVFVEGFFLRFVGGGSKRVEYVSFRHNAVSDGMFLVTCRIAMDVMLAYRTGHVVVNNMHPGKLGVPPLEPTQLKSSRSK